MAEQAHSESKNHKHRFIALQEMLLQYIHDAEKLPLVSLLNDPLVVPSMETYAEAYREQAFVSKAKKILKQLSKLKKTNGDLREYLNDVEPMPAPKSENPKKFSFMPCYFPNGLGMLEFSELETYCKEYVLEEFKNDMKRIGSLQKLQIQQPVFTRQTTVSSSHSLFIKKLERMETQETKAQASELFSTAAISNGVLKTNPLQTKPNSKDSNFVEITKGFQNGLNASMPQRPYLSQMKPPQYLKQPEPRNPSPNDEKDENTKDRFNL
ncbi:hypothetical protein ENBRE01_2130 [Enteropsectra breve]|nr:hypothetical protein ENBRE01_2130 [Enteropsectra breve]